MAFATDRLAASPGEAAAKRSLEVPRASDYFWIGPGRFSRNNKSAIKGLWIDKIEFAKASDPR